MFPVTHAEVAIMLAFFWWIIIGCVAGLLARFLVPGRQPMGWVYTIALGLAGSVIGGFISSLIFGTDPRDQGLQTSGLLMSTVGAVILLSLFLGYNRQNSVKA